MSMSLKSVFWTAVSLLLVGLVLFNAERGAISPSTVNPQGIGAAPVVGPVFPGIDWLFWAQTLAVLCVVGSVAGVIWGWRRHPRHPFLLMVIASNTVCWLDPINNWAIYLVYNPKLWHFPQDWPWVGASPIIEPLTSFIYAPFVLLPYVLGMPILRRLQATRSVDSFVWRYPRLTLGIIVFILSVIWDAGQEILLVSNQMYIYSHAIPFGTLFAGQFNQFPILMATGLITIVMIAPAIAMYRDDTGLTGAEKLARRLKMYNNRPATATFLVMCLICNLAFMSFVASFYIVRVGHFATSVACPWPFPGSKVYDPNGFYEREGQPGPYWAGRMSTWLSGQPDGRPQHIVQISDRCSPDKWSGRR